MNRLTWKLLIRFVAALISMPLCVEALVLIVQVIDTVSVKRLQVITCRTHLTLVVAAYAWQGLPCRYKVLVLSDPSG